MYVYKLTNKVNGKVYIGKANNPQQRLVRHFSVAKTEYDKNHKFQLIHKAIKKYGKENFIFEIIEKCIDEKSSYEREIYWIKHFQSNDKNKGYNLNEGGLGGASPSPETRQKISKKLSGRITSLSGVLHKLYLLFCLIPDYKINYYKSKKEIELESKRKTILESKGLPKKAEYLTDEIKTQILDLKSNKCFLNKHIAEAFDLPVKTINYVLARYKNGVPTKEQKSLNRSNSIKGRKHTQETKLKMAKARAGKKMSDESKQKISQANSGIKNGMCKGHSEETKKKMSESQKIRRVFEKRKLPAIEPRYDEVYFNGVEWLNNLD